ncbi:ABC transporter permease [Heliomicrobium modesticaldum]|nr:ABC transporter permease [Heliomicrobium modesticaldum]
MSEETKAELIRRMALDQPLSAQFVSYWVNLLQGDLGYSYAYQAPVSAVIGGALPWTLALTGVSLLLSFSIGLLAGIYSGWRRGHPVDRGLSLAMVALSGLPNYFIGVLLLLLFAVQLGWFPLSGAVTAYAGWTGLRWLGDVIAHMILPVVALTLATLPEFYLLTRSAMVNILDAPFMRTARAKGVGPWRLQFRHGGRNALLPSVARLGVLAGKALTGALFVEMVFAYPGLGHVIHQGLLSRDYPLVQGLFFIVACLVITCNLLADKLLQKLDPRVNDAY